MAIMKVKSTHPESQGPFVLIEEVDYDPKKHELYEEEAAPKPRALADKVQAALKGEKKKS